MKSENGRTKRKRNTRTRVEENIGKKTKKRSWKKRKKYKTTCQRNIAQRRKTNKLTNGNRTERKEWNARPHVEEKNSSKKKKMKKQGHD